MLLWSTFSKFSIVVRASNLLAIIYGHCWPDRFDLYPTLRLLSTLLLELTQYSSLHLRRTHFWGTHLVNCWTGFLNASYFCTTLLLPFKAWTWLYSFDLAFILPSVRTWVYVLCLTIVLKDLLSTNHRSHWSCVATNSLWTSLRHTFLFTNNLSLWVIINLCSPIFIRFLNDLSAYFYILLADEEKFSQLMQNMKHKCAYTKPPPGLMGFFLKARALIKICTRHWFCSFTKFFAIAKFLGEVVSEHLHAWSNL